MRVTVSPDGSAVAGFGGVQTCGSVWACPVCSEKVNAARHTELVDGIRAWRASGGSIEFATFTVQHHRGMALQALLDAISPAFNRTTSGAGVVWNGSGPKVKKKRLGEKQLFGVEGYVRLSETKHGDVNGWHPHLHVLFFVRDELTPTQREDWRLRMFGRWETALAEHGFKTLDRDWKGQTVGLDLRPVSDDAYVAEYFTKHGYKPATTSESGAAFEVTGSHAKKAGKGGCTPFELLERVVAGDADALDLWHEWEQASKGRRQLTWSRGLRARLGLNVELTDEEIAEADDLDGHDVARLSPAQYRGLARRRLVCTVLEIAEADPTGSALVKWLAALGMHDVRCVRRRRPGPSLFAA